jgi:hypothetical protein
LRKEVEPYGMLPLDRELPRYIKRQQVLALEGGGNRFTGRIAAVARQVAGVAPAEERPFFARLWNRK